MPWDCAAPGGTVLLMSTRMERSTDLRPLRPAEEREMESAFQGVIGA
jgi:hypothetical protein